VNVAGEVEHIRLVCLVGKKRKKGGGGGRTREPREGSLNMSQKLQGGTNTGAGQNGKEGRVTGLKGEGEKQTLGS